MEPDWKLGLDILCLVPNKDLYLQCRDFLLDRVDRGECLVSYVQGEDFKFAIDNLTDKNKYVFLLDNGYILPLGGIGKIYQSYLEKRDAGFISAFATFYGGAFYWVKDIYGYPDYIGIKERTLEKELEEVDIASPRGLMTKTSLFKDIYCSPNIDGGFDYSFGIKLRRQGYQNYVNTKVAMRQEGE